MKIIHHNDLDGYISGTIFKIKYPSAQCFSVNYDNQELLPKKEDFNKNELVIMVDYTIEDIELMNWLKNNTRLFWIDHHKSSLEKEINYDWKSIKGIRKVGLCGAELSWRIVFPEIKIPLFVKMVGNYDIFRYAKSDLEFHETKVMPFAFGAMASMNKMKPSNFNEEDFLFKTIEDFLNKNLVNKLINDGKIIFEYKKVQGEIENPNNCFVRKIWGYRVLCMNSCGRGSDQFIIPGTWNPEKHDMMLIFYYNGNNWAYGFYTEKDDVDVSKIAMSLGGGGHQKAAGACTNYLIEELKNNE